jgi:iron complex outermembrane receptor protein
MLFRLRFILFIYLFLYFFTSSVIPQEIEKKDSLKYEIQEVTVLGTRTEEKIIDLPFSVFRVDKNELTYGKKESAEDVLSDVPGLFLQSRYGNQDLRISIRGFGTRSNTGIRGVRILQDGIPESEPDGETVIDAVDFNTLGSVEVVKGNFSSLYANAPGGVINFVSDLYFPQDYSTVINQVGNFGYRQNGFKLGVKNESSRFLLSYNYRNSDGYRQHSQEFQHLVNAVYEGYVGRATITILGNFVNGITKLPGSLTSEEFASDPFQANPLTLSFDFKRITKKGRIAVKYKLELDEADNNELEVAGYGSIKELENADNQYYSLETRYSLGSFLRYTNRTELFGRNNIFTCGMDYAYQSGPISDFDNIYGNKGISVINEYSESLGDIGFYLLNHFNIVPDKLDLFLSGRLDRNEYSKDIFIPYGFTDTTRIFQKFAPKFAINYKLSSSIALYTSYGVGFDFPALNELSNTPISSNIKYSLNPDLNVQQSENFELGIKGNIINPEEMLMRKLFFEFTFFDYVISDEIVPFNFNQTSYFRNAAKTNRLGIEAGFKSEPFEGIELTINYTLTDFKYLNYPAKIFTSTESVNEDYTGNYEPSVPGNILNFILNYEFEISDDFSGLLQWDCDYNSSMWVNDQNSEKASPYFLGSAMTGINYSSNKFNAVLYIGAGNIFDKRYSGFININDYNEQYYETGEPRNFYSGLNISYKL